LFEAFTASKQLCYQRLHDTGAPPITLSWLGAYVEEERELFGSDFWPYGIEANRKTLEAFVRYSHEQGISERQVAPEELFAKETLGLV
jgi:4,5-dihydroxyphthalate decarboxylase